MKICSTVTIILTIFTSDKSEKLLLSLMLYICWVPIDLVCWYASFPLYNILKKHLSDIINCLCSMGTCVNPVPSSNLWSKIYRFIMLYWVQFKLATFSWSVILPLLKPQNTTNSKPVDLFCAFTYLILNLALT